MHSTIEHRISKMVEPSAIKVDSVKLTVATAPDTGELIDRWLEVDVSHDEDLINAVESTLLEQLQQA